MDEETLDFHEAQRQRHLRLESVGRLAGGVAHHFNNMLQIIEGYSARAFDKIEPGSSARNDLLKVFNAAQQSAWIAGQLLAFAQRQRAVPQVIDLNQAVADQLTLLQRLVGDGLQLVWQPASSVWDIRMDPAQVNEVLAHLCLNARDFAGGGGRLTVATSNTTVPSTSHPHLPDAAYGDYVALSVTDTGIGMAPEVIEHLFEPFFTTKDVGQGTGLGLATVYGIVRQNHGVVTVASTPGRGTTFTIYLPRHTAEAARSVHVFDSAKRAASL